jgi:hypothetical protein
MPPHHRHRLKRGGDRQLNRALRTIVMLRHFHHEPTRAYTSRRIAQGKSQREIRRCLKRTLARQRYRVLERTATTEPGRRVTAPSGKTPLDKGSDGHGSGP